ncbi:hypothetical protein NKG05_11425 [Oerskovia sp. M15]
MAEHVMERTATTPGPDCAPPAVCDRYDTGHHLHPVHERMLANRPWGWRSGVVDAVRANADGGVEVVVEYMTDNGSCRVWHHAALELVRGLPVRVHEQYHALEVSGRALNVRLLRGLGSVPEPSPAECMIRLRLAGRFAAESCTRRNGGSECCVGPVRAPALDTGSLEGHAHGIPRPPPRPHPQDDGPPRRYATYAGHETPVYGTPSPGPPVPRAARTTSRSSATATCCARLPGSRRAGARRGVRAPHPEQRQRVLADLGQDLPQSERAASDDPSSLARMATRAEIRNPGTLERSFAGRQGGPAWAWAR